MTESSVTHDTFVLERVYEASPSRVFRAFADPDEKARWFVGPEEWEPPVYTFDFRVGGRETNRGGPKGGPVSVFDCLYHDIVPDQRIVYSYEMTLDDRRISVSLATVELHPAGSGTRLVMTDHGVYLDGWDNPDLRRQGTEDLLDALGAYLMKEPAR